MDFYTIISTIFKYAIVFILFLFITNILKDILYYIDHESKGKRARIVIPSLSKHLNLKENLSVGRSKENDLYLDDELVSKRHMQIIKKGDFYFLKDLKSANGTYLNNEKVENHKLKNGDEIIIGKTLIIFEEISNEK